MAGIHGGERRSLAIRDAGPRQGSRIPAFAGMTGASAGGAGLRVYDPPRKTGCKRLKTLKTGAEIAALERSAAGAPGNAPPAVRAECLRTAPTNFRSSSALTPNGSEARQVASAGIQKQRSAGLFRKDCHSLGNDC